MAHILIVEDSVDGRESLRLLLEGAGHHVTVAGSGEAALASAGDAQPDLILIDIGLPGIDGYETARRIRARDDTVRLVALTGYNGPEDRERSLAAGFDAHFAKPLDPVRILTLLEE
jgi:CheY-like chemotaxis protein